MALTEIGKQLRQSRTETVEVGTLPRPVSLMGCSTLVHKMPLQPTYLYSPESHGKHAHLDLNDVPYSKDG